MNMLAETPWKHRLELWGGIECTVNRVGDTYFSQLERNGHATRLDDIDRFAGLGIRAIRYPVLWERVAPESLEKADWSWPDERLARLKETGVAPIVGLVHHGSGPKHTSLVDPDFPEKLAAYAAAVAQRYPWVEYYTPVNEPLTTARFSGLYGVWYPHAKNPRVFKDALLNQCKAVVLCMQEIRKVNPDAKLVQTDDLGKTYSTPKLAYHARFLNRLRWLSWDLLCGMVNEEHPLWDWLMDRCQATEQELRWFVDNACPPDIIGVNHYATSERFLDENLDNYPQRYHGGNQRHRFADIEASRALATPTGGIKPLIKETWERYHLPIAVTEVHIDAGRDDQMRWLAEIWAASEKAKQEGVDIRAVTVWSLLGSFDWNCLVTADRGYYEPGPFDVRGTVPRPTAVAELMRDLASGVVPPHPVFSGQGWWKRDGRFLCKEPVSLPHLAFEPRPTHNGKHSPILITGATGTLGRAFAKLCETRNLNYKLLSRQDMDIADIDSVERILAQYEPWAIVNAAGYVRVDDAERDAERCFRENTLGPQTLAAICARHGVLFATFSTDLVFDGRQQSPYVETDGTAPLNIYGKSKAEAEQRVLDKHPGSLVVRTSSFFGPWDEFNFITVALRHLQEGKPFLAANDMTVSPTYVPDLVNACLDLLMDKEAGIWHLTNGEPITWAELALRAAERAEVDPSRIQACTSESLRFLAPRPSYSALGSGRAALLPKLDDALDRYLQQSQRKACALHRE